MKVTDKYVLFWDGPFSNWDPSPFVMTMPHGEVFFNCGEQYMMYAKAMFFGDYKTAESIMRTSRPDEQKQLGREVKGYDDAEWALNRFDIVVKGLHRKFSQNEKHFDQLIATQGKIIVEASPYDRIWGIGLGVDDPRALDESKWEGLNLLGKACMRVRDLYVARGGY